ETAVGIRSGHDIETCTLEHCGQELEVEGVVFDDENSARAEHYASSDTPRPPPGPVGFSPRRPLRAVPAPLTTVSGDRGASFGASVGVGESTAGDSTAGTFGSSAKTSGGGKTAPGTPVSASSFVAAAASAPGPP